MNYHNVGVGALSGCRKSNLQRRSSAWWSWRPAARTVQRPIRFKNWMLRLQRGNRNTKSLKPFLPRRMRRSRCKQVFGRLCTWCCTQYCISWINAAVSYLHGSRSELFVGYYWAIKGNTRFAMLSDSSGCKKLVVSLSSTPTVAWVLTDMSITQCTISWRAPHLSAVTRPHKKNSTKEIRVHSQWNTER